MYNRYFRIFRDLVEDPIIGFIYVDELIDEDSSVKVCGLLIVSDLNQEITVSQVYDMKIRKEDIIQELTKDEFMKWVDSYLKHMYVMNDKEDFKYFVDFMKDQFEMSDIQLVDNVRFELSRLPEYNRVVEKIKF